MRCALGVLLFVAAALAQASSLERFKDFVRNTHSARADFEQKVYDRTGKLSQESKGSFMFQRPGLFRWVYAKPVDQLIVGDGERVWIHDRDLNQVTVRKLSGALGSTPAALLAGSADIEKAFQLSDAGRKEGLEWLEATPLERDAIRARAHGLRRQPGAMEPTTASAACCVFRTWTQPEGGCPSRPSLPKAPTS
jgi:outer membrane lipoprotein-sorting protein